MGNLSYSHPPPDIWRLAWRGQTGGREVRQDAFQGSRQVTVPETEAVG